MIVFELIGWLLGKNRCKALFLNIRLRFLLIYVYPASMRNWLKTNWRVLGSSLSNKKDILCHKAFAWSLLDLISSS